MKRRNFIKGTAAFVGLFGVGITKAENSSKIEKLSDKEKFYKFFEKFNGFPINGKQKLTYKNIQKGNNCITAGRQYGMTTLLVTISAWEALNRKKVVHLSSSYITGENAKNIFNRNCERIDIPSTEMDIKFINATTHNTYGFGLDTHFHFDNSGMDRNIWELFDDLPHKNKIYITTDGYKPFKRIYSSTFK